MFRKVLILLLFWGFATISRAAPTAGEIADFSGLNTGQIEAAMKQAVFQQKIIDTMTKPYEGKPWWQYRRLFITTSRINEGVKFYFANEKTLKRAYEVYGVPPEIICAIIGVETFYGSNMGSWKVLDALYTLGFHYPPRETYFSKEFGQFVKLALRENWNLTDIKGSYAGAMGMGQFMPTSYLNYAVDFDGDGRVDLFNNTEDAIGSVANYFKAHKWEQGRGIFYPAVTKGDVKDLVAKEWDVTGAEAIRAGVSTKVNLDPKENLRLFPFVLEDGSTEIGVGLHNFGVIMRYNKSPLYARAVYELAEFIRGEYHKILIKRGEIINPEGRRP